MKKLLLLMIFVAIAATGFCQDAKTDTVFFKSGRILPCKIIEVSSSKIKVRPMPEYPNFVDSYKHKEIKYYSFSGRADSLRNGNFYAIVTSSVSDTSLMPFDYYLLQSGNALRSGGNLMLVGTGLTVTGAALMVVLADEDSNEAMMGSMVLGFAGFICTIVGYSEIVRSGNLTIKAAKRYSIKTNGAGISFNF